MSGKMYFHELDAWLQRVVTIRPINQQIREVYDVTQQIIAYQ